MSNRKLNHRPFLVVPGSKVKLSKFDPRFTSGFKDKDQAHREMLDDVSRLQKMQEVLWASRSHSVLIIFQALDAAGKDGTIKHLTSGLNPQGCSVYSFKAPSAEEVLHDFLWRPQRCLPQRGQISIFNRSYYEEVLVVRVHPEFLSPQGIDFKREGPSLWGRRFEAINQFERHLVDSGTLVLKFFLNVSQREQRERFLSRLKDPHKRWKFSINDLKESERFADYIHCYEQMLAHTSTKHAPWYVIPADRKWFTRACVADIVSERIAELKLSYPKPAEELRKSMKNLIATLERQIR